MVIGTSIVPHCCRKLAAALKYLPSKICVLSADLWRQAISRRHLMVRKPSLSIFIFCLILLFSLPTASQTITGTGSYKGAGPGWDRGMQTTMHCGSSPESWVRGSATLDKTSGLLSVTVQLETDSVFAGPKGRVTIAIRDARGQPAYTLTSDEIGIGGKPPGNVAIQNFSSSIDIPRSIAREAESLYLDAQCTGSINRLFNISVGDLGKAGRGFDLIASAIPGEASAASSEARDVVAAASTRAEALSKKGTPAYTAALREELLSAPNAVPPNGTITPGPIDLDNRYRSNFSDTTRLWGGAQVIPGTFPDTVAITGNGGICTGIVIGPKAVLTAAHCYCEGIREIVYFGDSVQGATSTSHVSGGEPMIPCDPDFQVGNGDVAVLTVGTPLTIPARAFASTSLLNTAKYGRAVGYGIGKNFITDPAGIKRMVDVPMASINCSGKVETSPSTTFPDATYYHCTAGREIVAGAPSLDKDTCKGDSGGPLYVQGSDGALYLGATTSRPTGAPGMRPCGDGGIYVRTDGAVTGWLQSLGIRIFIGPER